MRTLILGSKGQLGTAFTLYFKDKGWECFGVDADELDITNLNALMDLMNAYRPGLLLNCAAYNLVDKAETDQVAAFNVNVKGPRNLAIAASQIETKIVHFSTDYVFDGKKRKPYTEQDETSPLNVYGQTKLLGEKAILGIAMAAVFRLSWLYGGEKQNFVGKVLDWAGRGETLRIADDEISVPTYTEDVVKAVMKAMELGLFGLWHMPGNGFCSRFEWAKEILRLKGLDTEIVPAKTADFKPAAERPGYSVMTGAALESETGFRMPDWRDSLAAFMKKKS